MIFLRLLLAASIIVAIAEPSVAAEVIYREDFGPPSEPKKMLSGGLFLGHNGTWSGAVKDERYLLQNDKAKDAAHYNYITLPAKYDLRRAGVTLTVEAQGRNDRYGTGILYDYDKATRHYWAFTVRDGHYLVLRREADSTRRIADGAVKGLDVSQPTQLMVVARDGKLYFFVNRHAVATVDFVPEANALAKPERGVGFIAFGLGRFSYDDFAVAIE